MKKLSPWGHRGKQRGYGDMRTTKRVYVRRQHGGPAARVANEGRPPCAARPRGRGWSGVDVCGGAVTALVAISPTAGGVAAAFGAGRSPAAARGRGAVGSHVRGGGRRCRSRRRGDDRGGGAAPPQRPPPADRPRPAEPGGRGGQGLRALGGSVRTRRRALPPGEPPRRSRRVGLVQESGVI